jgi:hypothetical protein
MPVNHRPNGYPGCCCQCGPDRVAATCCVDVHAVDKYGTDTVKPETYCRAHCPVCKEKET